MSVKFISSRDNPLYKELKQLATSSQARRRARRTLLDGVHLCGAYLAQRGLPVLCVVGDGAQSNPEVAAVLARCDDVQCVVLPDALYHALSQVENGIDLLFVIDTPQAEFVGTLTGDAVLLDNLQDPGNLGSILRSAAAAGIRSVYCSAGTAFAWSPKVLRAGMGAHFGLEIHEQVDLAALLSSSAIPVLATSSHAEARIYDVDLRRNVAWLFGHEGQGVSEPLMALASQRVSIPHLGEMESLNVAASAAVCLFEQVRQKTVA
ncbi:RNA methyltransferase|uniref:TrmH family RNA methyltransferase n=1 Tax=Noviherbaspirillum sp. L7-7A TaxID=2850560 RepID=UPI001C2C479F|nr:RNA methyltransferase [Noviherbaspirillum sp. L7-7A]MBV0878563.1 RNA methyltransferase [Noviherbaspirillum sp. L7-7A]